MVEKDKGDADPDSDTVDAVVSTLEQAQVADEQGNLEEADADLINRASSKIDSTIGQQVLLGAVLQWQTKTVLCLHDAENGVCERKDHRGRCEVVVEGEAPVVATDPETEADNDNGQDRHDTANRDNGRVLRLGFHLGRGVCDPAHD